jgi:hypothetical protein
MFKISKVTNYTWPVSVHFPVDGGRTEKSTFDVTFKRVSQSRIHEIRTAIEKGEITDVELAREVMIDWSGVMDGDTEVPFSEGARDDMLDIPMVASSVVMALFESISGAKRKN